MTADESFRATVARVRREAPLVQNITNHVVMGFTANALLAFGASPAMVHAPEEAAEFASLANALVINIGTLDATFVRGMEGAAARAHAQGLPWVLDPVGVGATRYRSDVCARLLALRPSVIRANASEILALASHGTAARPRGVDSVATSDEASSAARALALATGCVVAVTGAVDYVVSGERTSAIAGGHPGSQRVTGTGCVASALVGACLAVAPPEEAATSALRAMKAAAEKAGARASGPGSFAVALLDALAE
jgi:hydroxyethylthiazole kinase